MFERIPDYYEDARAHEAVFRAVLRDIKNRIWLPLIAPGKLDPEAPLDDILATYSPIDPAQRYERFTIIDFRKGPSDSLVKLTQDEAMICLENMGTLSGNGALLGYIVKPNKSVKYRGIITTWIS